MDNTFGKNLTVLAKMVREEVQKSYLDGVKQGAITTCAVIYKTYQKAGLPKDDLLFQILEDIAKHNNNGELPPEIKELI